MKTILNLAILTVLAWAPVARANDALWAQSTAAPAPAEAPGSSKAAGDSHADAYYFFMLGHLQEQQFDASGVPDQASQSIESYKKALSFEPGSTVI